MRDLSLHILDIAENGVRAGAGRIDIRVRQSVSRDAIEIGITDDGLGMTPAELARATDPFYTTRTTRKVGLGLSFLRQAAEEAGGSMIVRSRPGKGTEVKARFVRSHIDRKPMGDLASTMVALIAGCPDTDFFLECSTDDAEYRFDTRALREELGPDVPLNDPELLDLIRDEISAGIGELTGYG